MKVIKDDVTHRIAKLMDNKILDEWGKMCSGELLRISREIVPFDQSPLSVSGFNDKDTDGIEGWFTAYNEEYAARQHEEIDWNHPNGRQAKYLERPFHQNIDKWQEIAKEKMLSEIKKVTK